MFGYPNADLSHWLPHRQGKGRQNLQSPDDDGGKGLLVVEGPQFSLHQKPFLKKIFLSACPAIKGDTRTMLGR